MKKKSPISEKKTDNILEKEKKVNNVIHDVINERKKNKKNRTEKNNQGGPQALCGFPLVQNIFGFGSFKQKRSSLA